MKRISAIAIALVFGAWLALPARADEQIGSFGAWQVFCSTVDKGKASQCVAESHALWDSLPVFVFYAATKPMANLAVGLDGRDFSLTARIDNGAPHASLCHDGFCYFDQEAFYSALAQGGDLRLELTVAGQPPFTVQRSIAELRQAAAAAQAWMAQHGAP